ncbi:hypothetical protein [Streptomyces sp. NBC_00443]|uniref:hypothetical protein n=1 Tax=Streptomyces sp. NBC_00443 TaxID=2975743 RepID=UPI002E1F4969
MVFFAANAHAGRARTVAAYANLPDEAWTAYVRRRFELDALFANHDVLLTGRIALPGLRAVSALEKTAKRGKP